MRILLIILFLFVIGCEPNPTVTPAYIINERRPIGFKCDPVEAVPGDTVSMEIFIGGRTFSQDSDLEIKWLGTEELTLPYTKPLVFPIPENIENMIPDEGEKQEEAQMFIDQIEERGFLDFPVMASFENPIEGTDESRTINVSKTLRIYPETPEEAVNVNPVIENVKVSWYKDNKKIEHEILKEETLTVKLSDLPETMIFFMQINEDTGYDRISYSWYFTSDFEQKLDEVFDLELDSKKYNDLIPEDERATHNRKFMAITLKKVLEEMNEKKDELPFSFNFYGVIRDRAVEAEGPEDYRWGQDFIWFKIEVTE